MIMPSYTQYLAVLGAHRTSHVKHTQGIASWTILQRTNLQRTQRPSSPQIIVEVGGRYGTEAKNSFHIGQDLSTSAETDYHYDKSGKCIRKR